MNRYAADRTVKRLAKQRGTTKWIPPHSLRHSFITAALDAGVPLRDVQEAASHADPRTTMRYDRVRQSLDRHVRRRHLALSVTTPRAGIPPRSRPAAPGMSGRRVSHGPHISGKVQRARDRASCVTLPA